MTELSFKEAAEFLNEKLNSTGVFLSAGSGEKSNTMTISWGSMGIMWSKPIMIAPVRNTRHTFGLIKEGECFTVSIPIGKELDRQLAYCGSHSGRDVDKYSETGLTAIKASKVDSVIIQQCQVHLECKVRYQAELEEGKLPEDINEKIYHLKDYHTLFVGEIVRAYRTDI